MRTDSSIVVRVLTLLRQYGWESGYKKFEAEARAEGHSNESDEVRQFFFGWMAAERGNFAEAVSQFQAARQVPMLAGWALLGEAFVALRGKYLVEAIRLLGEARRNCEDDPQLLAAISHVEGATLFHQGKSDQAVPLLIEAIKLYSPHHFGFGRVLDTFGMLYASKDNFQCAREFFGKALVLKHPDDLIGLAVTHGQLGRLYLDWGYLDKAQGHFEEDLKISRQIGDDFGKATMCNFLGNVCLLRAEQEAVVNRTSAARREWEASTGWLESAARLSIEKKWPITEGYVRKDQARLALARGDLVTAEVHATAAENIFKSVGFNEGLAHVNRVLGMLRIEQRRWEDGQSLLRSSLSQFQDMKEPGEITRTLFAIARACAAAGEPRPLVRSALLEALSAAEACRRAQLVRQIEEELKLHDPAAYASSVYRRVRGRAVDDDAVSLIDGTRESATVLFLDLQGSTELLRYRDPGEMLMTLNEMMANFLEVLRKYEAQVIGFRGDGFVALLRGLQDAVRGVEAALDLHTAMNVFNEPRAILDLPPWIARIGVNTGDVFLGNVGTYDKLDFSAIGHTMNLAARLEGVAEAGMPCIGRGTYEKVQTKFVFRGDRVRQVVLKGLGTTEVWDVVGRARGVTASVASDVGPPKITDEPVRANVSPPTETAGRIAERKRFTIRRSSPTTWEFAFGSNTPEVVGKHLVGFTYLAVLVSEADREVRPIELLQRGSRMKRASIFDDPKQQTEVSFAEGAAEADRMMGSDDRMDERAMKECRKRLAELKADRDLSTSPAKQEEIAFIESQLRTATRMDGKRVGVGPNRMKLDYNAVKKAIDAALAALGEHKLVSLAAHLSTHVQLSIKACIYHNSARLDWEVAYLN